MDLVAKVIKGAPHGPRGKWDEVQAIQDEPFIFIMSNGSKCFGQEADDIDKLAEMLQKHTLDPRFKSFYSANPCQGVRSGAEWIDGPRMCRVDGVVRFFGNFLEYSHGFHIDTNDRTTIDLLIRLIDANVHSDDYKKAEAKWRAGLKKR